MPTTNDVLHLYAVLLPYAVLIDVTVITLGAAWAIRRRKRQARRG